MDEGACEGAAEAPCYQIPDKRWGLSLEGSKDTSLLDKKGLWAHSTPRCG